MAYLSEVGGPAGDFVIRAEPWGIPQGLLGFVSNVHEFAFIRRALKRDHSWIVRVRQRSDDPFGAVVHEERVMNKAAVPTAIARLESAIRDGSKLDVT